jgi:hypothetical protein
MRYICRLDDPLAIKAYGYVGPGGLGEFDPATHEEVEGDLPEGWTMETQPKPLLERLSTVFESVPQDLFPPAVRVHFRLLQSAIRLSLEAPAPDVEAARYAIETATLPDGSPLPQEAEAFRADLLAEFEV